jgi:mannose/cellobiose epimerase-like protein (N-acyl-D-glucosamine 2-epimerase family)
VPGAATAQVGPERPIQPSEALLPADSVERGAFWRRQGLKGVLPGWTRRGRDTTHGGFFANLDRSWERFGGSEKYPGMLSRHVYSYSAAYLLGGNPRHLDIARNTVDVLIEHGWDERYGGWYESISRQGAVTDSTKDLFMQIYAATGLTLYYAATHDERALRYVRRTNRLLERRAWDDEHGGYVRTLNRDLSVRAARKDFTPQGAMLSGYLLTLYRATRDSSLLRQAERVMDVLRRMRRPADGWVRERFARDWSFDASAPKNASVSVGHNVETAWLLLRMHALTGRPAYRDEALSLADSLHARAYHEATGAWRHTLPMPAGAPPDTTPWWVQAYGNMFELTLYHETGRPEARARFREGARFWNEAFVDDRYGGTVLKAGLDGTLARGEKAVRTKTSYHALEHSLLTTLYLNLWVRPAATRLHFRIPDAEAGEVLYPSLVDASAARIRSVRVNGEPWSRYDADARTVRLPAADTARVEVVLAPAR